MVNLCDIPGLQYLLYIARVTPGGNNKFPIISTVFFAGAIILGLGVTLRLITEDQLSINYSKIVYGFEVWRLLTACVYEGELR